ncbi:MAG TPA: hypothetical protein VJ825_06010 [Gemmatimonadaceae bacterium]|nr:hypothetical protein [Gemmatimonadaceae bacterium]
MTQARPDSVRGIVSITGTDFDQHIVIRSANAVTPVTATPADSAALSRIGGVEVLAIGSRSSGHFHLDHFTALAVDGSPVVDGVLRAAGDGLKLDTANGTVSLGNPPDALRNLIAARVWIAGPLDTGPNSYGVISLPKAR